MLQGHFKHNGWKNGVTIRENKLLWEIGDADIKIVEISYVLAE